MLSKNRVSTDECLKLCVVEYTEQYCMSTARRKSRLRERENLGYRFASSGPNDAIGTSSSRCVIHVEIAKPPIEIEADLDR